MLTKAPFSKGSRNFAFLPLGSTEASSSGQDARDMRLLLVRLAVVGLPFFAVPAWGAPPAAGSSEAPLPPESPGSGSDAVDGSTRGEPESPEVSADETIEEPDTVESDNSPVGIGAVVEAEGSEDGRDPCRKGFLGLRKRPAYCAESRKPEYAFLPAIFVQKETGLGFAVFNELLFYTHPTDKVQPSRVSLTLTVTARRQFISRIPTVLYFQKDDYVVDGYVDFRIYPNRYYGIGNESDWNYQVYREDVISTYYEFRRRIVDQLYGGLVWNLRAALDVEPGDSFDDQGKPSEAPEDALLEDEQPDGWQKNLNNGLGLELVYDGRDDIFYPRNGGFYRAQAVGYSKVLGGDYGYVLFDLDARYFIQLFGDHVLALQLLSQHRTGSDVPFSSMGELGGPRQMRGFYQGRNRDKHYLTTQVEYRFPIYKRLGGATFASLGEVYGTDPFSWDRMRWSLGGGLRMRFGERIYMRVDGGGSLHTGALIFAGGQTF